MIGCSTFAFGCRYRMVKSVFFSLSCFAHRHFEILPKHAAVSERGVKISDFKVKKGSAVHQLQDHENKPHENTPHHSFVAQTSDRPLEKQRLCLQRKKTKKQDI